MVNAAQDSVIGTQVAGLFNVAQYHVQGSQQALLFNATHGNVRHQASLLYNGAREVERR
ncbi:MAG: hypothetical protein R2795_10305 [Saprospiraceae bacterium]